MTRAVGQWKLPQPVDIKEEEEWLPIPRIARTIPFGYVLDEADKYILNPVKKELDLLDTARKHVLQYSYREVAHWLTTNSGRYISHVGLMKRLKNERRRRDQAKSLSQWAAYAEKAIAKTKEIQESRTGARERISTEAV